MNTWAEQFKPISDKGWDLREGQEKLGNAIIDIVNDGGILVGQASTGTGKSLATAIPLICKINEMKSQKKIYRGVISTETITLQSQLTDKDLPFLQDIYGGFTFTKLLGRSNYLCLNQADDNAKGSVALNTLIAKIRSVEGNIQTGEYKDVIGATNRFIDKDVWGKLTGSSEYCSTNKCSDEQCYGAKARKRALSSDIVVVNHALLGIDYDMKFSSSSFGMGSDGMLGDYDALIVDEAHKLEDVLSSQWTERMTEWEINDHTGRLRAGLQTASVFNKENGLIGRVNTFMDDLLDFFKNSMKFFSSLESRYSREWAGSETSMCLKYLPGNTDQDLLDMMTDFEVVGPTLMESGVALMDEVEKYIIKSVDIMVQEKAQGKMTKEVRKAFTSTKYLRNLSNILGKALKSEDGVISHGGTTYGVVADGWIRSKDNSMGMTIRCFPIDISQKLRGMWATIRSTALLSATLTDLTEGTFRYFKSSLGIDVCSEVDVRSPFVV